MANDQEQSVRDSQIRAVADCVASYIGQGGRGTVTESIKAAKKHIDGNYSAATVQAGLNLAVSRGAITAHEADLYWF